MNRLRSVGPLSALTDQVNTSSCDHHVGLASGFMAHATCSCHQSEFVVRTIADLYWCCEVVYRLGAVSTHQRTTSSILRSVRTVCGRPVRTSGVFNLYSSRANLHISYNPAGRIHCRLQNQHGYIKDLIGAWAAHQVT